VSAPPIITEWQRFRCEVCQWGTQDLVNGVPATTIDDTFSIGVCIAPCVCVFLSLRVFQRLYLQFSA
jgi:hypothetical protein